jgi:mannose-6-phosphate isomerase-like protein (cupin superfamily)
MQKDTRPPDILRIADTPAERFASGRETRRLAGVAGLPTTRFAMGHSTLDPGGSIPEHQHPNEEVYVVLSGSGLISVGDERQDVAEGCCVFIPPDAPHFLQNTGNGEMTVLWIYAPPDIVDHWAQERAGRLVAPRDPGPTRHAGEEA